MTTKVEAQAKVAAFKAKYEVRFPTVQEFRAYLQGLKKDANVVGFCKKGACPIAQWALDTLELPKSVQVWVGGDYIEANLDVRYVTPGGKGLIHYGKIQAQQDTAWAEGFIALVDKLTDDGTDDWQYVTPAQAIKCLDRAVKGDY